VPAPPRPRSAPAPAAEPLNPNAAPATAPIGIRAEPDVPIAPPDPGGSVPGAEPGFNPNANLPGIVQLAPPPAPAPQQPIRPSAGMQVPKKVVDVAPAYPPIAIAARKEGVVILEAIIDVHGNVESVRALRADPLLLDAAVDAVRQWKYTPGVLNGIAVPVIMTVTVNFKLQ
ncbi:MAG TPA: energy transducer TonB, partial [Vicinamibacterales bacterium]|nr:energy transducer TonB [Vicinamibacterales bacterium]